MSGLTRPLLTEILRDAHRYAPGLEPDRPTSVAASRDRRWRTAEKLRERSRDLIERAAARAGFSRRHFPPELGAARLERILELSDGLTRTYESLADDASRRALLDVLKLRVLGPYHAPLAITPERYRNLQEHADRELRLASGTFDVSDPWFSPLSLYRVPVDSAQSITLHSHSVDLVSVFLLGQYSHARVHARPGDVVLDIGGCWGDTALYFASLVGPHGKVYTFEFDPGNLAILRTNLALNPDLAGRVEVVERALWDSSGEMLQFAQAGRASALLATATAAATGAPKPCIRTITLDDFAEQAGLDRVEFLKMDVEGAELRVLRGAGTILRRFAPRLAIAAYHTDHDLISLPEALEVSYHLYLDSFSALEDETVLFAEPRATSPSSST